MRKKAIIPLLALLVCLTSASCRRDSIHPAYDGPCHCGVDNPLDDLAWLHRLVVEFESMRGQRRASISICTYDSTSHGFLITDCEDCPDRGLDFLDCQGNALGLVFGFAGTPYSAYNIDPASVRVIYRNYADTVPTITNKQWFFHHFFDRVTQTIEVPTNSMGVIPFWLQFAGDGTVRGGGINHVNGTYTLNGDRININIQCTTEIYDMTGWEDRLMEALNSATICDMFDNRIRLYYDQNRKYLEYRLER